MVYYLPVRLDENLEPLGIFSLASSMGDVVIVATEPSRASEFVQLAQALVPEGERMGLYRLEATSLAAVLRQLVERDPSVAQAATFIEDSDPIFANILDQLRHQLSPRR